METKDEFGFETVVENYELSEDELRMGVEEMDREMEELRSGGVCDEEGMDLVRG